MAEPDQREDFPIKRSADFILLFFAYNRGMERLSGSALRREISRRNLERARSFEHEASYGAVPSVVYREEGNGHGNFLPASYRAICTNADWERRLRKSYTGGRWFVRSKERVRCELDCANSSDALLMNIFCYPRVMQRTALCSLLDVDAGVVPDFGFRARVPLTNARFDRTECDMRLGETLFEAKLTESDFQTAQMRLLLRYRDLTEVFEIGDLPVIENTVHDYQLIRGVLAAYASGYAFVLLYDRRRADLVERWLRVLRAVKSYSFRSRMKLIAWQEIATTLPPRLRSFLDEKYGIAT